MELFVLDTNFFFNLQENKSFGKTTEEVVKNLSKYLKKLKALGKASVYMPPSVVEELKSFFEEETDYLKEFLALIQIKAPNRNFVKISGQAFYEFVKETRERSYRGLKIAEEEARKAAQLFLEKKPKNKIEFEKTIGEVIKNLRERYRNATRTKMLDSKADVDLLLLTKELEASLVSTDEGVLIWAEKLGLKTVPAHLFKQRLESLLN